jgi:hypothetical protein
METDNRYRMEVKHRWSAPRRYTWEIFDGSEVLPRFESRVRFLCWEEASIAGKIALAEILRLSLVRRREDQIDTCPSYPAR